MSTSPAWSALLVVERRPITSAPRDGRVILVSHPDGGEFAMAWNDRATNALFAPGEVGMWEAANRAFTWREGEDCGPSMWRPLPGENWQ